MDLHLEPSVISGSNFLKKLKNNNYLKLKLGIIVHSSGFELQEGIEYEREILPIDGEWLILVTCQILCWKNSASRIADNSREVTGQTVERSYESGCSGHIRDIGTTRISDRKEHLPSPFRHSDDKKSLRSGESIDANILEKKRTLETEKTSGDPLRQRGAHRSSKERSHLVGKPNQQFFRRRLVNAMLANQILTCLGRVAAQIEQLNLFWRKKLKLVNYPFYRQQSDSDCGAACLAMIVRFWGKKLNYQQIVKAAKINRSGASLANLIEASESVGFSVFPGKTDLSGLEQNTLPAIAHWDGNHYVVVYKVSSKQVTIGEPKIGVMNLSRQDFCTHWTGYALWLNPLAKFYQQENTKVSFGQFFGLLQPYKLILCEILTASLVVNILGLLVPIFTQILLDKVVGYGAMATFWAIGSALLMAQIVQEVLISLRRYLLFHTAHKLDLTLIVSFISHALKLPLSYFESRYVGDIISRVQENRKIRQFLTADAITVILDLASIFLFASLMFWYSPILSVLALAVVPILIALTWLFTPVLMNLSRQVFNASATEQSYLIEFLSGIATVKSLGVEQSVRWRWESLLNRSVNISFNNQMIQERLFLTAALSETIISISVLLLGIWQVLHGQLTIGQLVAFNMLTGQV
ncbi:MAG: peptidase domain-containing ABC transporter, partial [Waterburya sp.]